MNELESTPLPTRDGGLRSSGLHWAKNGVRVETTMSPSAGFDPGTRVDVWVAHQAALQALRQVLSAFATAGIEALAVKGIVLAHQLYDDVADRPIQDVDLRVCPADLHRVIALARQRGWALDRSSRQLGCAGFRIGRVLVEVETTVGPAGLCPLRVKDMLGRSVRRTMPAGFTVLEPEPVDHAILLVVNAFKDKIVECPSWSRSDLVRIVQIAGFDQGSFVERVLHLRLETMTWIVADWLIAHHETPRWREIQGRLRLRRHTYARAYSELARSAPAGLAMRLVARMGSDSALLRAYALGGAVAGTLLVRLRNGASSQAAAEVP